MAIDVTSISRFSQTEAVIINGIETFGRWKRPDFINPDLLDEDQIRTFGVDNEFAGRPDLIATDFYGSPLLEWVVIMFNNPQNPIGWPVSGSVIRLPERSLVLVNT
jgi:hypothetical protein